jgi:uncharacterized protein (UPF0333 family)
MKTRLYKDNRGIAHLAAILVVVIVLAVGGVGYYVYSKNKKDKGSNSTTVANSEVVDACNKAYNDKDLCKFSGSYNAKGSYKATYINTDKDGNKSTLIVEADSKGNSSTITKDGDSEVAAYIFLDGEMYVKNLTDNSWTKYPKTENSASSVDSNPAENLNIDTSDSSSPDTERITYKKLGKEACGSETCFKYQVIDPSQPNTESIIWFSDKDYQLRKWSYKDADGATNVGEFSYTSVTINAPSPVKEFSL